MKQGSGIDYFTAWREASERIKLAGLCDPDWQSELLLRETLSVSRAEFLLSAQKPLNETQAALFSARLELLIQGTPLQYILGQTEFYGRKFALSPAVLIPRADTEVLVEVALKKIGKLRAAGVDLPSVLDLCTGSGCVGLTIAAEHPELTCALVDISPAALAIAMDNSRSLGLASRVEILLGDLFAPLGGRQFDLIVSNPPYIPTNELNSLDPVVLREPLLALDGGTDGLDFYRRILKEAPRFLTPRGYLALEIGSLQSLPLLELSESLGFSAISITRDLAGHPRVIDMRN